MRRLCSILLSLFLVLTLAACGGPVQEPGSASGPPPDASQETPPPVDIPFSLAAYPSYSFHPVLALNRANLTLAPLLYEPLFQVDAAFRAVPVLCQAHTVTEDKLCWTFTLRSGVTFSDGTPLTGEVVAAALELARQPESRYAQRLRDVSAVTAAENSVTIYLRRPKGDLPVLLDIPIALSGEDRAPGTGPYVLAGTEDDLTLSVNTDVPTTADAKERSSMTTREVLSIIESILFASGDPVPLDRICRALDMDLASVEALSSDLCDLYAERAGGIRVIRLENSLQMISERKYADYVRLALEIRKSRAFLLRLWRSSPSLPTSSRSHASTWSRCAALTPRIPSVCWRKRDLSTRPDVLMCPVAPFCIGLQTIFCAASAFPLCVSFRRYPALMMRVSS